MALPSAPASISLNEVNVELGLSGTAAITLNDTAVRTLFGVPSGQISMSDGYGKSNFYHSSKTKGYQLGGSWAASAFYRLTFSTDTTASLGSYPAAIESWGGESGNKDKTFHAGGYKGGWSSATERITYATDAVATVPTAGLSSGRGGGGAWGNSDKGFFCGGWPGTTTSDKITYSNETRSSITALPTACNLGRACGNNDYHFVIRGSGGGSVISKLTHSTDTHSTVPIVTTREFYYVSRLGGNIDKGFVGGGDAPGAGVQWNRITYATTSIASSPGMMPGNSRSRGGSSFNSDTGWCMAGFNAPATRTSSVTKTNYSAETTSIIPATVASTIEGACTV